MKSLENIVELRGLCCLTIQLIMKTPRLWLDWIINQSLFINML